MADPTRIEGLSLEYERESSNIGQIEGLTLEYEVDSSGLASIEGLRMEYEVEVEGVAGLIQLFSLTLEYEVPVLTGRRFGPAVSFST